MALELIILKKPYEVNFSGNPIVYNFQFTPYTVFEQAQDIKIQLRIEKENGPGVFAEIYNKIFYPDNRGTALVDIQTIVDAHLKYYTPKSNLNDAVLASKQFARFRVIVVATKDGQLLTTPVTSDVINVIKGGLAYEKWQYADFFALGILAEKRPLHFFTDHEIIRPDEVKYLYWLYPIATPDKQFFKVHIDYTDGTDFDGDIPYETNATKWSVQACPLGYKKLIELLVAEGYVPAATPIVSFTIEIRTEADDIQVIAPITFYMDYRNYYDPAYLIYTNSLGGKDTVAILGEIDASGEYTTLNAQKIPPPSGFENSLLVAQNITAVNEETEKFAGNTNFISKEALNRLRDLLLSREVYEIKGFEIAKWDPGFIPVVVNKKTVKFFNNKERLFGMAFEWQNAFVNSFYTPMGAVPPNNVCPALETFLAVQITKNTIQIIWSMPMPYDILEVTIDGGDPILIYGNTGSQTVSFINPLTYPDTGTIEVKGRVVCDLDLDPVSYGPYTTLDVDIFAELNPVANDDLYYLPAGYDDFTTLNRSIGAYVTANDYDPDGDAIEVVPSGGVLPTTAGGQYNLFADGHVDYKPPSTSYNGQDSFTYTIQQVSNPLLQDTATVRINVGNVGFGTGIYIKVTERNHWDNGEPPNSGWLQSNGDFYLTFWADPQATVPKNLSGLGIYVNYKKTEILWLSPGVPSSSTVDFFTVPALGTEVFIGHLITAESFSSYLQTREFSMEAGLGYIAI